jgi:glycopeptide antibiotics resistance protein
VVLSANVLVPIGVVAMLVVIVEGRARGASALTLAARCALIVSVSWILALTIFPIPIEGRMWSSHRVFSTMSFVPLRTIGWQLAHGLQWSEARQIVGNVALFAPFGLFLPLALRTFRRSWITLLAGAGLSMGIEIAQSLLPGHSSDIDDVLLNAAGTAVGFLAFSLIRRLWSRDSAPGEPTFASPAPSSVR